MSLDYKRVPFEQKIASVRDFSTFKPTRQCQSPSLARAYIPVSVPKGWYYLGPLATSDTVTNQQGLIVKPLDDKALADVVDWEFVAPNNGVEPPAPYSSWKGVAPDGYVVVGHFFVNGPKKPSAAQTAGIKAIRNDLVQGLRGQRLIWLGRQPRSVVTIWDVFAVPTLYIGTGAFVSSGSDDPEGTILPVLRLIFNPDS